MSRRHERTTETVVSVTTAQPGKSEELDSRIARYAWMMSIRIVCFVLAVITPSPWRWAFVAAAIFLPYFAVVLANAKHSSTTPGPDAYVGPDRPAIGPAATIVRPADQSPDPDHRTDTEK